MFETEEHVRIIWFLNYFQGFNTEVCELLLLILIIRPINSLLIALIRNPVPVDINTSDSTWYRNKYLII